MGGVIADALLGDPRRGHPVALFGRAAQAVQDRLYADRRLAGVGYTASCVTLALGPALLADYLTRREPWARLAATAATAWAVTGAASLAAEAERIAAALERGDCAAARAGCRAVRARPCRAGRDRAGEGHRRVGRREHLRRGGRPAVLGRGCRAPRAARVPGGQHARRDGRPPVGALRAVRLGGGPARRRRQPGPARLTGLLAVASAPAGGAGRARRGGRCAGTAAAPEPQRGPVRGGVRRRARRPARRAQRLRRRARTGPSSGDGRAAPADISARHPALAASRRRRPRRCRGVWPGHGGSRASDPRSAAIMRDLARGRRR